MEIDLGRVLDGLPAMVWTAQSDGRIDFVNRRWSDYTGLGSDEADGCEWQAAVEPDALQQLLERWRAILASGEPGELEARVRRFDGQYRRFLIRISPLRDDAERIVKWCGVGTDIEDLRQTEETLLRRQIDFQLIVDSIPVPVAVTAPSGEVEGLNQPTLDYFGKTFEELRDWKTSDLIHPDDLEATIAAQLEAHRHGTPFHVESRHRRADGVYRWHNVHGLPLRDPEGCIFRWLHLLIDVDDRKRAEEALRENEQNARLLVDSIPGMVSVISPEGEVELVNRQILEYGGGTQDDQKHWATNGMVHPEDVPRAIEVFKQAMATGVPFDFELRRRRSDGVYHWFQSRGLPLRDADGHIIRWYNLLIDIDERKHAEDALRASEGKLSSIVDGIPGFVAIVSPEGINEFVNRQILEYCGHEDFEHWHTDGTVHEEDVRQVADTFSRSITAGVSYEFDMRLRRFDGVYRWFNSRGVPVRDDTGRIARWYVLLTDIEDRKQAEERLRRSEAFLADAQRLSRTGSFSFRIATDEITWSEEMYRIYGLDPAVPLTVDQVQARLHPDSRPLVEELLERARHEAGEFDHETRLLMPDQSVKYLHTVAHGHRNEDGVFELRGAVQDVTETRLAEEALSRARTELAHVARVSSLGALTASIAHEVKQPLSGIITNAGTCLRMLAADPPNVEGARETARRTIRDGNRAADVITRLRALFSKDTAAIEPVDLNEAVREVIALSSGDLQRAAWFCARSSTKASARRRRPYPASAGHPEPAAQRLGRDERRRRPPAGGC